MTSCHPLGRNMLPLHPQRTIISSFSAVMPHPKSVLMTLGSFKSHPTPGNVLREISQSKAQRTKKVTVRTSPVLEQTQVPPFSMERSICSVAMVVSTTKESLSTTCLYLTLRPKYGQRSSLQITLQRAEEAILCLLLAANSTSMVAGTPSLNSPTPLDSI